MKKVILSVLFISVTFNIKFLFGLNNWSCADDPKELKYQKCSARAYDYHTFFCDRNSDNNHTLAIVVPFRDRFEELLEFIPKISRYLQKKSINFKIFIVNQYDSYRFNRASLINVGFLTSMTECDYMVMHDVDLIPLNYDLDYTYPKYGPYHVSSPDLHPKYNYKNFIGGILIVSNEHFLKVNGMSTRFWGWGREDDEFFMRLQDAGLNIIRPDAKKIKTDSTTTFLHDHCPHKRKRDTFKYPKQKVDQFKRDNITGLDTIQYRIVSKVPIQIGNYPATIVNVNLYCKKSMTPWCDHSYTFMH